MMKTTTAIARSASPPVDCQVARALCSTPNEASADVAMVDWGDQFRALKIGKLLLSVRPSIGISIGPWPGAGADALIKTAGVAMLRAKRERLGYAFFDDSVGIATPPSAGATGPAGSPN